MTPAELMQASPAFFYLALGITGLAVGSFLNVVIHRLPLILEGQWQRQSQAILFPDSPQPQEPTYNLAIPPSHCPRCQHVIGLWENIPLISYLLLKGRCSSCGVRISWRYPAVELGTALLTLTIGSHFGVSLATLAYCLLAWSLLALALIDLDTQLLPDAITLPLLWGGLAFNSISAQVMLHEALWGAIGGYLALWSVYWLFRLATGKEGMGYGDFKLLAALGAWLGWTMLPLVILLSSLVGSSAALGLILLGRHQRSQPIPFGPYLVLAGLTALLWGDSLVQTYIQWAGN